MAFTKNRGSRVFHLMMILPAGALLLVLSLVTLSTLAVTNRRFLDEYEEKESGGDSECILFAEKGDGTVNFRGGDTCNYGVVGAAILGGFAIAFTIWLAMKALFGVHVVSCSVVVELILSTVGAIWAFIVSVVITVGLEETCNAYADTFEEIESHPCCSFFYRQEDDDASNVYFYEGINTSRITAWFAMAVLMFLSGVYISILLRYCCREKKASKQQSTLQPEPMEVEEKKPGPNPF